MTTGRSPITNHQSPITSHQRGGVLFAVLAIIGVVGVMLISYLSLVSGRARSVARSQSWNQAVPASEAGLEEGMAHLNQTKGRNMVTNGWTASGGNAYAKSYDLGWARYDVRITNTNAPPAETLSSVEAAGSVKVPGAAGEVTRRFRVTTRFRPQIEGLVAQTIGIVAGTIRADSYDSTLGPYNAATARDNAFIGTASTIPGQLEVTGGAQVYGSVGTGVPGGLKTPLPKPTVIGDAAFVNDPASTGYQSGHYSTDLSVPVSTVPYPPFPGIGSTPSPGLVGFPIPTNYMYVLDGRNFKIAGSVTMNGPGVLAKKILVTGNAALWITDTFTLDDDAEIIIAPNAKLTLYMEKQFYMAAGAKINMGGRSDQFAYYGMTANAEFYMSGYAQITGVIYAPQAKMYISGSSQLYGAVLCNEFSFTGSAQFHYDESLAATKEQPFLITSWTEL